MIDTIAEFFSTAHGSRGTPGWMYLLYVLAAVGGALVAKDAAERIQKHKREKLLSLDAKHKLQAAFTSEENEEEIEYRASITKEDGRFHLKISEKRKSGSEKILKKTLSSWDELSEYLRTKTKFVITDFK